MWLNGTFGAGKTTTAAELARLIPGARIFDPETAGLPVFHVVLDAEESALRSRIDTVLARWSGQAGTSRSGIEKRRSPSLT